MLDYTKIVGPIPFHGFSSLDYGSVLGDLVDECLYRFERADTRVMLYLARETAGRGIDHVQIGTRALAFETNTSHTTVKRVLHMLEDRGFITVETRQAGAAMQPNVYRLVVRP